MVKIKLTSRYDGREFVLGDGKKKKAKKVKAALSPTGEKKKKKAKKEKASSAEKKIKKVKKSSSSKERSKPRLPSKSPSRSPSPPQRDRSPLRSRPPADRRSPPPHHRQGRRRSYSRSLSRSPERSWRHGDRGRERGPGPRGDFDARQRGRDLDLGRDGRTRDRRDRVPPRSDPSDRRRPAIASSIGAVISHDSDGEYNPEMMLKKSLVASEVKVTSRPSRSINANKNLVMKAVAESNRSIKTREREGRQRNDELDAIHLKRMQLSKALKQGNLDERKIEQINKDLELKKKPKAASPKKMKKDSPKKSKVIKSPKKDQRVKSEVRKPKEEKKEKLERSSESLEGSDLRHILGKGKRPLQELKIQVTNDQHLRKSQSEEEEEDLMLEKMRQRALDSMNRRKQQPASYRIPVSSEKKIIIPLNDDSSDFDTDSEDDGKNTVSLSSSSSSSSSSSGSESEAVKKKKPVGPTFIVTLDGVDKAYFKSKSVEESKEKAGNESEVPKEDKKPATPASDDKPVKRAASVAAKAKVAPQTGAASKPVAPVVGQKRPLPQSPLKKPEAKVAPLRKPTSASPTKAKPAPQSQTKIQSETASKTKRKPITGPGNDKAEASASGKVISIS